MDNLFDVEVGAVKAKVMRNSIASDLIKSSEWESAYTILF